MGYFYSCENNNTRDVTDCASQQPEGKMADFNSALQIVLKHEGGYVNNPKDPGGATNMGVTIPTLARYRGVPASSLSSVDMQNLKETEVAALYKKLWWDVMLLDQVTSQEVATVMFDQGVLFGESVVVQRVQGLVGVKADGQMGPMSVEYVNKFPGKNLAFKLIRSCSHRDIITALANNETMFLGDWIDRLFSLLDFVDYGNPF
jgi:lysozyme family protein